MTLLACIDIGNSTTEVLLARTDGGRVQVVGVGRSPTRRAKGSPESLAGAVALVRRLERQYDVRVDRAVAAPLRPVLTSRASLPEDVPDTGRLAVVAAGSATAAGRGFGAGPPVLVGDVPAEGEPVVVVVPSGSGYANVAGLLAPLVEAGRVAAVLVEDDEAVLLANRLPGEVPVVDEVDPAAVLAAERVAVEVAAGGQPMRVLTDPLKLRTALGLAEAELADAAQLARLLHDTANAVVTRGRSRARRRVGVRRVDRGGRRGRCRSSRATSWSGRVGSATRSPTGSRRTASGTTSTTCGPSTWPRSRRRCRPGSARPATGR